MAAAVKVVEEEEITAETPVRVIPPHMPTATPPAPAAPHPDIVAAIQQLNGRLQAVETTIQGVPASIGLIRSLIAALGNRALMALALLGCLALAGATALWPSWQGLAIFCGFAVLAYLPMAYLASRGN